MSHLFQEGWLHTQIFGDHIQTEEVSVDACTRHGHPIEILMLLWSQAEEAPAFFIGLEYTKQKIYKSIKNNVKLSKE